MTDGEWRMERIEKLLRELRYEVTRGMMEGEISEEITYGFIVPVSHAIPNGVVRCEFRTHPLPDISFVPGFTHEPRLHVVK